MAVEVTKTANLPLIQRRGEDLVRINPATIATQVSTADGGNVEDKIVSLSAAVAGQTAVQVVADITARDALTGMLVGDQVWVVDATGDSTVTAGAAKYLYESAEKGWIKTAEAESMDVILKWADIQDKPTSAVADIDDAVAKRHEHVNKADLDQLSVVDGAVAVNGTVMKSVVTVASLPETMPADLANGGLLIVDPDYATA